MMREGFGERQRAAAVEAGGASAQPPETQWRRRRREQRLTARAAAPHDRHRSQRACGCAARRVREPKSGMTKSHSSQCSERQKQRRQRGQRQRQPKQSRPQTGDRSEWSTPHFQSCAHAPVPAPSAPRRPRPPPALHSSHPTALRRADEWWAEGMSRRLQRRQESG
jgi:hypothetical protein